MDHISCINKKLIVKRQTLLIELKVLSKYHKKNKELLEIHLEIEAQSSKLMRQRICRKMIASALGMGPGRPTRGAWVGRPEALLPPLASSFCLDLLLAELSDFGPLTLSRELWIQMNSMISPSRKASYI